VPEREELKAALRKAPLFAKLEGAPLEYLAARALRKAFAPGEVIFSEGEPCKGLYVVASGSIRIFKTSAGGREQTLAIDGPGSSVAELPVFDGGAYPASAAALTHCTLVFVAKETFQALCREYPEVALHVLKVVGARLRRLVGIIEELSFTTVRQRLAAHLLRLAQTQGKQSREGVVVALGESQQELASHIGTVRELVSRNLSRLQAEGIVRLEGKTLTVLDMQALEEEVRQAD
jgi:CRP/FNR family transcriptional regulator